MAKVGRSVCVTARASATAWPGHGPRTHLRCRRWPRGLLFIAGGIGITPIMSMIRSFGELAPAPWKLVYLTRSAAVTAFRAELSTPAYRTRVKIHHDQGDAAKAFDLWPLLERPNTGHLYCCGPNALMDAVRGMTGHWTPAQLHFESFVDGDEP